MDNRSVCTECGRVMSPGDSHRRCKECRMQANPKEVKVIHHYDANKKLDQDAAEAHRQKLSYGKWQMREEMKKRGEIS